jgi:AraC-like DNA-binding protein
MSAGFFPPPSIRHVVHRLNDPDEFTVAVSGGRMVAEFFGPRLHPTIIEQFQTADWSLDFQEAHVKAHVFCPLPPGWATLGLMRSNADSRWHGFSAHAGVLMCNPPGEPIDGCINPGFRCLTVNVPAPVWERGRILAGVDRVDFGAVCACELPPMLYTRIERQLKVTRHFLRCAYAERGLTSFAAGDAAALVAEIVMIAWELSGGLISPPASHRNRARLAHRAEEWMRGHLTESAQVPEVCLALRVSRRELEYAFRLTFDQSPRDFLQALRLNAIRQALKSSLHVQETVTQVAVDHGVMHLSRFAAQYRDLFGESPSETRRHVRLGS